MQPTQKYYEADAYRTEAAGHILAAEPDGSGGGKLALDGTVFYPEGGGQPADRGTLTLPDGTVLHVTDVHEQGGVISHTTDALPETAAPGTAVQEALDWAWRFDKMQQHSGEHILCGILHQMFGAENVGFHIGPTRCRLDASLPIPAEGLREAELAANRIVWQNVPVLITYPTPEELAALTYRSKKDRRPGAHRDHPGRGRVRLLRHPHRRHRPGGPDQDPGRRELQGRRPAERGLRRPGPAGRAGHAAPSRPTSARCSSAKAGQTALGRPPASSTSTRP